jgi:hypothetical protein
VASIVKGLGTVEKTQSTCISPACCKIRHPDATDTTMEGRSYH